MLLHCCLLWRCLHRSQYISNFGQRTPALFALLRLIGATPRQIQSALWIEALAFGIPGSVIGVVAGVMGGRVISQAMKTLYSLQMPPENNYSNTILCLGLCFGPVMTVISVWYPARAAAGVPPLSIVRQIHSFRQGLSVRLLFIAGFLLLAASTAVLMSMSRLPQLTVVSVPAIIGIQIAAVLMLPAFVRGLSSLVYRIPSAIWPVESLLGKQQILDKLQSQLTDCSRPVYCHRCQHQHWQFDSVRDWRHPAVGRQYGLIGLSSASQQTKTGHGFC